MVVARDRQHGAGKLERPRRPGRAFGIVRGVSAAALCAAMLGCSEPDPDVLLARGERLVSQAKWHEAMQPLKQCLLLEPGNAGAHFLLGRAYLNARYGASIPPWRLTITVGEMDTALHLFQQGMRETPLSRYTPQQFETMCHVIKAQAHLRKLEFGFGAGIPPMALAGVVENIEKELHAARAIMPESKDVQDLERFIAPFKRTGLAPQTPPSLAAPREPADVI